MKDGMLLRSGHSLKNENTLTERINLRRSLMSGNEYEAMTSSSQSSGKEYKAMSSSSRSSGKYYEMLTSSSQRSGKDYDGMTSGSQKSNKDYERVTSSSRRSQTLDRNHINSDIRTRNRRSLMSANEYNGYMGGLTTSSRRTDRVVSGSKMHGNQSTDMTTIRKTLIQEFEEDEEKGMKDSQSTKKKKKTSTVINHLYGMCQSHFSVAISASKNYVWCIFCDFTASDISKLFNIISLASSKEEEKKAALKCLNDFFVCLGWPKNHVAYYHLFAPVIVIH
jgi:hypothetical protein